MCVIKDAKPQYICAQKLKMKNILEILKLVLRCRPGVVVVHKGDQNEVFVIIVTEENLR